MKKLLENTIARIEQNAKEKIARAHELAAAGELLKIEVYLDENAESPREWSNVGKISVMCRDYNLSDKDAVSSEDCDSLEELKEKIIEEVGDCVILPIYLYDHGGFTISTSPFTCRYDSGKVGFIYCEKNFEGMADEEIKEILEEEVETYDTYLRGENYAYRITNAITGGIVEACGGYCSEEEAQKEGEAALTSFKN